MTTTLDNKDRQISATIANIRLPLMLGVVLCHCMIPDTRVQPFSCVQTLLSQVLTQSCVPIFFIMSGFLFFWKVENFDVRLYKKKMKSRTKSLIIPYLLWNVICVIFYAFLHKFMQGYINPENQNVLQYSAKEMLLSLWDGAGGFPINYPLWFLRNLIVVSILAPLFYVVAYRMGYIRYITLLMLTLLFLMVSSNWIFTVFFFYVGVMLAKEIEKVKSAICRVWGGYFVIVNTMLITTFCVLAYLYIDNTCNNLFLIERFIKLTGVFVYLFACFKFSNKCGKVTQDNGSCSFFIYLCHAMPLMVIAKILDFLIKPSNSVTFLLDYILRFFIVVFLCTMLCKICKRFIPKSMTVLTGSR